MRRLLLKKLAQNECVVPESLGILIHGKEVAQLITEDSHAAWLQPHEWRASLDFRAQLVEDLAEQALGSLEHAEVVKWAAAAERSPGHHNLETRGLQHLHGGDRRLR